jgi:hypothetical protein
MKIEKKQILALMLGACIATSSFASVKSNMNTSNIQISKYSATLVSDAKLLRKTPAHMLLVTNLTLLCFTLTSPLEI